MLVLTFRIFLNVFFLSRIQDNGEINAVTNPINAPTIRIFVKGLEIEGGGLLHGTYISLEAENVTIDDGGIFSVDGEGYNYTHTSAVQDQSIFGMSVSD